jgi:hypothetical protein
MARLSCTALSALSLVVALGCGSVADDAEGLCEAARSSASVADPAERATETARRFADLDLTSDTREALDALASAPFEPEEKCDFLRRHFRENGVENWQCPELCP